MLHDPSGGAMVTFFPFTERHCEYVEPVIVNYFNNTGFKYNLNAFENKIKNLHKCNIHVAVTDYHPYMFVTRTTDGQYHLDGIEGLLLNELSRQMNFTLNVKYIDPKSMNGKASIPGEKLLKVVRIHLSKETFMFRIQNFFQGRLLGFKDERGFKATWTQSDNFSYLIQRISAKTIGDYCKNIRI